MANLKTIKFKKIKKWLVTGFEPPIYQSRGRRFATKPTIQFNKIFFTLENLNLFTIMA